MTGFHPAPLDVIHMEGFAVHGLHGVLDQEKREGHTFLVDCRLQVDTRSAGRDDALDRTVSYADVAAIVQRVISAPSVDLIETLAARIAEETFAAHPLVRAMTVRINKPTAPIDMDFRNVAIEITRQAPPVLAVLAVGSNLGDRADHLRLALAELASADGVEVIAGSDLVETAPVGGVEQGDFLNGAIAVRTTLSPWQLLDLAQHIEQRARRVRLVRWGPRTLDVDVITWGDLQLEDPQLTLPHPRAHERAFVLQPLLSLSEQLGCELSLPGRAPIRDLIASTVDLEGLRTAGLRLPGYGQEAQEPAVPYGTDEPAES